MERLGVREDKRREVEEKKVRFEEMESQARLMCFDAENYDFMHKR